MEPEKDTTNKIKYKLKKNTLRYKFFYCGFEAGKNFIVQYLTQNIKPDQLLRHTDIIKLIENISFNQDIYPQ